jgi:hypothetical protein
MFRRLIALAAVATVALPAVASAAVDTPSALLRALESGMDPQSYAVEVHGNAEGTYMSMWAKGVHQGMSMPQAVGEGVVTVDIENSHEGIKMRLRANYRYRDGVGYAQLALEGAIQDDGTKVGGNVSTKKWVSIPLPDAVPTTDEMAKELLGAVLQSQDVDVDHQAIAAAANDLAGSIFTVQRVNGEYSLKLRKDAATEVRASVESFLSRVMGMNDDAAMTAAATLQAILDHGANVHLRVRLDAKDMPTYSKLYVSLKGIDTEVILTGTAQKLWSPVRVQVPTDIMPPEALDGFVRTILSELSDIDVPSVEFFSVPVTTPMPPLRRPAMPPASPLTDIELPLQSSTAGCTDGSIASVNALRKGQTCGRPIRSRRHLR